MEDNKRKLYDALSEDYDLGSFEQFSADIADDAKRRKLFDATSEEYDFGDYETFSKQLGFGPKVAEEPVQQSVEVETPATAEPQPYQPEDYIRELGEYGLPETIVNKSPEEWTDDEYAQAGDAFKKRNAAEGKKLFDENRKSLKPETSEYVEGEDQPLTKGLKEIYTGKKEQTLEEMYAGAGQMREEVQKTANDFQLAMENPKLARFSELQEKSRSNELLTSDERQEMMDLYKDKSVNPSYELDSAIARRRFNESDEGKYVNIMEKMAKADKNSDEYKDLEKQMVENPFYQESKTALGNQIENDLDAVRESLGMNETAYSTWFKTMLRMQGKSGILPEQDNQAAAARMLAKAAQTINDPSKYDNKSFLQRLGGFSKEFGKEVLNPAMWMDAMTSIEDMNPVRNVFKKVAEYYGSVDESLLKGDEIDNLLTDDEKTLLKAYFTLSEAQAMRPEIARYVNAARSGAESMKFVAEMALTGGFSALENAGYKWLSKTAKKLAEKSLGKWVSGQVAYGGARAIAGKAARSVMKLGGKTLIAGGLAVPRSAIMPSSWGRMAQEAVTLDDNGKVKSIGQSFGKGFRDSAQEVFTESMGEALFVDFFGELARGAGLVGRKAIGNTAAGRAVDAVSDSFGSAVKWLQSTKPAELVKVLSKTKVAQLAKAAHFDGFLPEMGEEALGAAMDSMWERNAEPLKDFFGWDNLLMTAESFLPMYVLGAGAAGANLASSRINMNASGKKLDALMQKYGYTPDQVRYLMDQSRGASVEEISKLLSDVGANITNSRFGASAKAVMDTEQEEIVHTLRDYLHDVAQYNMLDAAYQEREDIQRYGLLFQMEEDLGRFYGVNESGLQVVRTANVLDENGNTQEVYVPNGFKEDGEMPIVRQDGSTGFIKMSDIAPALDENGQPVVGADGQVMPAINSQNLDAYLSGILMERGEIANAQEVANRVDQTNEALRESVVALGNDVKHNGQSGHITNFTDEGATFVSDDADTENELVSWAELAKENGIVDDVNISTPADDAAAESQQISAEEMARRDLGRQINSTIQNDLPITVEMDGEEYTLRYVVPSTIDAETGRAKGIFATKDGRQYAFDFDYKSVLNPSFEEEKPASAPTPEPAPAPEPENTNATFNGIPLGEDGEPVYTAEGVTPEMIYDYLYQDAEEGDTETQDEFVMAKSDEADEALKDAKEFIASVEAEKEDVKKMKPEKGEGWESFRKRKAAAMQDIEDRLKEPKAQLPELERVASLWKELRDVAQDNIDAREAEAKRQELIKQYGVDISKFDLTPATPEEAVAEYLGNGEKLIDLEDARKETLGRSKSGRVPIELFRHLGNGGLLTSEGGRKVADVANDIVGEYENTMAIDQDQVRDIIIDYLTRYTKTQMRELIFQNRLNQAIAENDAQQNGASEEEAIPAEEAVEEAPQGTEVPEEAPAATVEEPQVPEVEQPEVEAQPEEAKESSVPAEISERIANILSGKDKTDYRSHLEDKATIPDAYYDEIDKQWKEYNTSIENQIKPLQQRLREEVDKETKRAEETAAQKNIKDEVTRENYINDLVSKYLKENQEYQSLAKQIDELRGKIKPEVKEKFRHNAIGMLKSEYAEKPAEGTENKPQSGRKSGEKTVTSQEGGSNVPATAADIKNKEQARAYFEGLFGKGKRADNSVRAWELTHKKKSAPKQEDGMVSQMAMSLANDTGLSDEEAAELVTIGTQLAEDYITEDGLVRFPQFFKNLVETFGDGIRPFAKSIYLGASANVSDELADQMDDRKTVRAFDENIDLNDISDEQESNTDVQQEPGGVPGSVADTAGEGSGESGAGTTDTGASEEDGGSSGPEVGVLDGGDDSGSDTGSGEQRANGTPGHSRGRGRKANDGVPTGKGSGRNRVPGQTENGASEGAGLHSDGAVDTEAEKEARAKAQEDTAYEAEKERIKDETDTKKLKALKDELKAKLQDITDKYDEVRAKLNGQLRAVLEKLKELFSNNANKSESLAQEKVPYVSVADPEGKHDIGSVVPSGAADYMRDAVKRLEAEVGKTVAEYVKDELGYKDLEDMFSNLAEGKMNGLASEQVDAVGLAIHQMKTGRVFVVGDMTGTGKGRVGAAVIRWAKKNGKKVIFCTEKPGLFSAMYGDIADIGGLYKDGKTNVEPVPWIVNSSAEANITDSEENILVSHPSDNEAKALYSSGSDELPVCPGGRNRGNIKGKQYDFVMTTYSQLQATEEEEEGDSEKVKKKNARNSKGRQRFEWLKKYAKDAVIVMDESHTAAGEDSTTGENAKKLVEVAKGVTFMSATFAKTPQAMGLYAIRSSMNDAMITRDQLIAAIDRYGIPMQEILAAALFKTGEMVRRERDFDGVKTNWLAPEEAYSEEEIKTTQSLSDKTVDVINAIIDFQRRYVDPVITRLNKDKKQQNEAKEASGAPDIYVEEYASTPYSGQVSNVIGMMLFALKAKKAAEIAIKQIKNGEKPVIAVDNTLGAYVDQIEGNIDSADFGAVLMKGLAFAMRYQLTTKHKKLVQLPNGFSTYKEVPGDRQVEKYDSIEELLGENAIDAMNELARKITDYGKETLAMDLPLSPIDYIKKKIEDAGYRCGEITKRKNALVQNPDGTWRKQAIKAEKPKVVVNKYNGGLASKPLPKEETYDAVVMNRSGATGNSMHASKKFGDQRPRKMIILQAAKDPNNEVQIRGRIDRTGQVHRGEYFYIISPIPAEKKITMMLKQKLASLDANSVGSEKVASNKVEAEDMDNKYGDEVARDFLVDHEEIHFQMDAAKQMKRDRKTGEFKVRPGLLYNLLLSMQRMTVADQETILSELEEAYAQKIEYLNQNGINDLATTTMNLDAVTIDSAIMIKGKDNDALSEFAHDTTIERVEVNVLRKPLRSEDIHKKSKELGVGEKHTKTNSHGEEEEVSYGEYFQQKAHDAVEVLKAEKKAKQAEAERKMEEDLRAQTPKPDGMTDEQYDQLIQNDPKLYGLKLRNMNEYTRYEAQLQEQLGYTSYATNGLKPGWPYKIPLNDSDQAESRYGRFIGFKTGKDGRPKSIEAVFATRDSRAMVSLPVVNMHKILENVVRSGGGFTDLFGKTRADYGTEEGRMTAYDKWWDKMTPANSSRSMRYMITGNILQAAGILFAYRGTITTFTRKDPETGEVTVDKGLLLAEDFDPENFMVRTAVTKDDVWENPGEFNDEISNIAVYRDGNELVVKFFKRGKEKLADHPVQYDEDFKALCEKVFADPKTGEPSALDAQTNMLVARTTEKNAAAALDYLYKNYGFTQGHLLVMPDSTDKPDRIVYTNKPYKDVIESLKPKYRAYGASSTQQKIDEALKEYKMDITNEDLKNKIRELVQLRQAYLREDYAGLDDSDLAWNVIIHEQEIEKLERTVPNESPEQALERRKRRDDARNIMEAYKEELYSRGFKKGTIKHFKQGKTDLDTIKKTFDEFNSDPENAKIAKKVFDIMKKLKVNIFLNEKTGNDTGGYTAGDMLSYNWRFMNEDWIPDQLKANTILHEMVHTATVYAIRAVEQGMDHVIPGLVDAANQAKALYNAIYRNSAFRHQIGESSWNYYTDYGAKYNAKEMLAETGANQSFRDDLAKVKVQIQPQFGQMSFTDVTGASTTSGNVMSGLDAAMDILSRLLDNFNPESYRKMWEGTGYGEISAPAYYKGSLSNPIRRADAIVAANEFAKALGVKFKEDSTLGEKGAFDPKTGQIRINLDNHRSAEDLQASLLHEAVGHYGLRKLLGKEFASQTKEIYDNAAPSIKAEIDRIAREEGYDTVGAVEEYLSQLAEDGRFTPDEESFWQKVWYAIQNMLRKLGLRTRLTDADMRALLYASHRNLQTRGAVAQAHHISVYNALRKQAEISRINANFVENGNENDGGGNPANETPGREDTFGTPGDVSERLSSNPDYSSVRVLAEGLELQRREYPDNSTGNGINELPEEVKEEAIRNQTEELYRRASNNATAQTAAQVYGRESRTVGNALYEVGVDEFNPVDILTEAIAEESGKPLGDSERVSDALRETGGKAMHAIREYDKKYLRPMWDALGQFRKNAGASIEETERYIGLKSGLERDVVLAARDARRDYESQYAAVANEANAEIRRINVKEQKALEKLQKQLDEGKISDVTFNNETTRVKLESAALRKAKQDEIDAAKAIYDSHVKDIELGTDPRFQEYRKKDYSAITAWAQTEDLEEAERLAGDYVADMESRAGKDATDELWKRINAATKETLKFQYEHDMLTKQQYNDVAKMMKYYVPMRGFEEDTAEDLYNYYVTSQSNDFQPTLLGAKGRKTLFEGPLGNIGAMHSSAVSQGMKNQAKLSLLNVVRNRKNNSLATITRAWFVKTNQKDANGRDVYEVAYPQIPEGADFATRQAIIEQFEQDMHDLYVKGDAYNAHREVDLHGGVVAFERESHKNEHVVKVREGGREYGIIINGNPAAAQAINGVKRGNGAGEKFLDIMRTWTRFLSQMFTTFSVPFWVSNFQRDHGQGLTNTFIRNDKSYLGKYILNRYKAFKVFPMIVGKEGLDNALAKGDPVAKLYRQYLENGGPMGQNRIEDNEYFERQMKRYLDNSAKEGIIGGAKAVLDVIGGIGEAIETITRFAVFMTSVESGRSIHESISDAKEVSTNFARKGSGRSLSRDELDRMTHADGSKLSNTEKAFVNGVAIGVEICRATIPFFNAAVQGLENKVTNYRNDTIKTLLADSIYFMLGFAMQMFLGAAGGDDDKEKYSHTSDYLRRNNILNQLGNGVYAKWALPQEYRVMFAMGDIVASALKRERPAEDLAADAFGALMQLSPIGAVTDEVAFSSTNKKRAAETLLTNLAPGTLAPVLESIFNRDFKGARLYNEGFNENLRAYPGWTKAIPTTGKEYVAAAKFLNNITGGNDVERGWIDLNPAIVEHLIESYFSGPYQLVVRGPEAIGKAIRGEAGVRDIPLVNRLLLNANDNQRDAYYSNMYYYFKEKNTEASRIFSEYKQRGGNELNDFVKRKDYQYMLVFKQYENMEKSIRKAGKKAEQKGDMAGMDAADAKIQDIHEEIARRCLDIYFDRQQVK